jgi:Sodium / potassium ATPase beta chain
MAAYNVNGNDCTEANSSSCIDWNAQDPCNRQNSYGYRQGTPCVFMKLSKNWNWVPQLYNVSNLPRDLPVELKTYIEGLSDVDGDFAVALFF